MGKSSKLVITFNKVLEIGNFKMKRLFLLALLSMIFISCSKDSQTDSEINSFSSVAEFRDNINQFGPCGGEGQTIEINGCFYITRCIGDNVILVFVQCGDGDDEHTPPPLTGDNNSI